jgi:hypothetical protein
MREIPRAGFLPRSTRQRPSLSGVDSMPIPGHVRADIPCLFAIRIDASKCRAWGHLSNPPSDKMMVTGLV